MKTNIESYFDAAKKARNTEQLLSDDEILLKLAHASPTSSPAHVSWKIKALGGAAILISGTAIFLSSTSHDSTTNATQSHTLNSQPTSATDRISSLENTVNTPSNAHAIIGSKYNDVAKKPISHISATSLQSNRDYDKQLTVAIGTDEKILPVGTPSLPKIPISDTKDIKGVERLELTESEAIVLATHYPKLHVWLQQKFGATDTCDISLAPTDKDKADYTIHHSALLLKINFEHTEPREFLLWFTPNKDFTNALPERHREQLKSELHALAEVETHCIPADQACKAVKGDSPFFDLCRRESGALSGVTIAPNPARASAECTFTLKEQRDVNISLHDLNGRFVRTMIYNELKPIGENKVPLMLEGIPAGAYLLALRTERGEQAIQQIVVGQ